MHNNQQAKQKSGPGLTYLEKMQAARAYVQMRLVELRQKEQLFQSDMGKNTLLKDVAMQAMFHRLVLEDECARLTRMIVDEEAKRFFSPIKCEIHEVIA